MLSLSASSAGGVPPGLFNSTYLTDQLRRLKYGSSHPNVVVPRTVRYVADVSVGGSLCELRPVLPARCGPIGKVAKRGIISSYSRESRRRFLRHINRLDRRYVLGSRFVTLTYPDECRPDARGAKKHLDTFLKRLRRQYPEVAWYWKMEYGAKSGHIHFHLMLLNLAAGSAALVELRRFVASAWYLVVGSGLEKHLKAGTSVLAAYGSYENVTGYIAKYMGKAQAASVECAPGRWWGHSQNIEQFRAPVERVELSRDQAAYVLRVFRKCAVASARSKKRARRKVSIYAQKQVNWLRRATSWLCNGEQVYSSLIPAALCLRS